MLYMPLQQLAVHIVSVLGQRDLEPCERLVTALAENGESRDRDRFEMKALCSI